MQKKTYNEKIRKACWTFCISEIKQVERYPAIVSKTLVWTLISFYMWLSLLGCCCMCLERYSVQFGCGDRLDVFFIFG